jgi:FtsZ-binding cell division protein ZapB
VICGTTTVTIKMTIQSETYELTRRNNELTKEKDELTGRHNNFIRERNDFIRGKVDLLRERDELTKKKDDFIREKETFIGERAELERAVQKLEGQRPRNASRITRWIQVLEESGQEVDIIRQVTQQGPRYPGRFPSPQQPAGRANIAFGALQPVNKARPRRP